MDNFVCYSLAALMVVVAIAFNLVVSRIKNNEEEIDMLHEDILAIKKKQSSNKVTLARASF